MHHLTLIGIGSGDPDQLTLGAIKAMRAADLVMVPGKGAGKEDLAELRHAIMAEHAPETRIAGFDLPRRCADGDYREGVEDWHDRIARVWSDTLARELPQGGRAALLVWGDPSLYDSTLRIAARLDLPVEVVPGITSLQVLTAAHAIPLNTVGGPVTITTGRNLRDLGWPEGAETLAVMLDGECSFQHLVPDGISIWWGAFLGMKEQITLAGPLGETGPRIVETRAAARAAHGWIMDCYLLRKDRP